MTVALNYLIVAIADALMVMVVVVLTVGLVMLVKFVILTSIKFPEN